MASNNTYKGALEVLAKQLATMQGLPDANLPFCQSLMDQVTTEMRSPEIAMAEAGILPPGASALSGGPQGAPGGPQVPMGPGGPGGMSAPAPSFMGEGVPGPVQNAPSSNPDELRRILEGQIR